VPPPCRFSDIFIFSVITRCPSGTPSCPPLVGLPETIWGECPRRACRMIFRWHGREPGPRPNPRRAGRYEKPHPLGARSSKKCPLLGPSGSRPPPPAPGQKTTPSPPFGESLAPGSPCAFDSPSLQPPSAPVGTPLCLRRTDPAFFKPRAFGLPPLPVRLLTPADAKTVKNKKKWTGPPSRGSPPKWPGKRPLPGACCRPPASWWPGVHQETPHIPVALLPRPFPPPPPPCKPTNPKDAPPSLCAPPCLGVPPPDGARGVRPCRPGSQGRCPPWSP